MKSIFKVAILGLAASSVAGSLRADFVYDNGPINGTLDAWNFGAAFAVSSSFAAPAATALTSATIGLWADGTPTSLSWSIGTTAFGAEISSGTATLSSSSTLIGSAFDFSVFESSFGIAGVIGAGTYYLTLSDGADSNQDSIYWDINNGPSTAFEFPEHFSGTADVLFPGSNSPSFILYGEAATGGVPDPGGLPEPGGVPDISATLSLLFVGLGAVHGLRRRLA